MKIEEQTVRMIYLSELEALDPVSCVVEDTEPGVGKLTIECYGLSWTTSWNGMGDRTVIPFVASCDTHYLANRFSNGMQREELDEKAMPGFIRAEIIRLRKTLEMDRETARECYNEAEGVTSLDHGHDDVLCAVFGPEWFRYDGWPTRPRQEYAYMCRIIDAVHQAFQQLSA